MKDLDLLSDNSLNYKKVDFGKDFFWGISTSKIYEEKCIEKYTVNTSLKSSSEQKNSSLTIENNLFENYKEDIKTIKELGLDNFKFSILWSKILPDGIGKINEDGIEFYNDILKTCKEYNIEPFVTLHHSDLPLALENKGGWTNRDIIKWFEEYVTVCLTAFNDKVKYWIVLNKPSIFLGTGFFLGIQTSRKKGINNFLPSLHHSLLCQSTGYKTIKKFNPQSQVGTSLTTTYITPRTYSEKNIKAAERIDTLLNKIFIEPTLGLGYPIETLPFLKHIAKYMHQGDEDLIKVNLDFIDLKNYTREVIEYNSYTPFVNAKLVPVHKRVLDSNIIDWEINQKSIYMMILKLSKYEGIKKIIVSENGNLFSDNLKFDSVNEDKYNLYPKNYLQQVLYAKYKSEKVIGFFISTIIDDIELFEDCKLRFEIINLDHNYLKKIIKNLASWYKKFLKTN